jgi:hypothetical protein
MPEVCEDGNTTLMNYFWQKPLLLGRDLIATNGRHTGHGVFILIYEIFRHIFLHKFVRFGRHPCVHKANFLKFK